jgi:hypothetical protein
MNITTFNKSEMKTMVACTNALHAKGFTTQFKAIVSGLMSLSSRGIYFPEEVEIVDFFRFEGESDPEDNSILYVIETTCSEKGTLTDAYGMYGDPLIENFVKKVKEIHKKPNIEEK